LYFLIFSYIKGSRANHSRSAKASEQKPFAYHSLLTPEKNKKKRAKATS